MQIALDEKGNRIWAGDAEKQVEYYCPTCSKRVILKCGNINITHFAHQANECEDKWHYDMSEWHLSMQNRFKQECREVVVKHNGSVHRADILSGDKVIEFQHSPITYEEIIERNDFYRGAGYKVAWVFDLQDQFISRAIQQTNYEKAIMYEWRNPKKFLQCFPMPKEQNKELVLFFYWIDAAGFECFNRVTWSSGDGYPDFKRFIVSEHSDEFEVEKCESLDVEDFFVTKADLLHRYLAKIKARYNKKRSGIKGYPKQDYICPKTGTFGISKFGEEACRYCRYCAALENYQKGFTSYCCYPVQVNEVDEAHPGYECSGIPEF